MTVVVVGWLISAGVAVVVGLSAIDALGSGIVGPASPPLSASDVQRQLATLTPAPTASPGGTSAPTASTAPPTTVSTSPATGSATGDPAGPGVGDADSSGSDSGSDGGSDGGSGDDGGGGDSSGTDTSSAPPPPTSDPPPSPPPPPADEGVTEITSTDGGTVISTCRSGMATISASPAQGFVKENFERGPDEEVGVRFESDSVRVDVSVTCSGNEPVVHVDTDRDN